MAEIYGNTTATPLGREFLKNVGGTTFAPAIKQNMSGRAIKINDASPTEHELNVKVKNYFDTTKVIKTDKVQVNDDKTLTVNNPNAVAEYVILGKLTDIAPDLKGGETINLFYKCNNSANSLGLKTGNNSDLTSGGSLGSTNPLNYENGAHLTITLPTDISNIYVSFSGDFSTHILSEITITCGEFTDLSEVNVSRCAKNFFDISKITLASGAKDIIINDKEISFEKNVGAKTSCSVYGTMYLPKGTYTASGLGYSTLNGTYGFSVYDIEAKNFIVNESAANFKTVSFTLPESKIYRVYIYGSYAATAGEKYTIKNIQFELGTEATTYEPYRDIPIVTVTANADGTVSGLKSISPSTTVFADKEVTLECEYIADTKLYIDNKFTELTTAIISLGGNV